MIVNSDTKFFIGGTQADKVMLGTTVIWEKTTDLIPNNEIWYVTFDNTYITYDTSYNDTHFFGATVVSHTYNDGKGVMKFDGDVPFLKNSVFKSNDSLKSITLPNSITEIGLQAFWYCEYLTNIKLPSNLTYIGGKSFANCYRLSSITIPNKVTIIDSQTFEKCRALTTITIPKNVTEIGLGAFRDCTNLTEVYFKSTTPPKFDENYPDTTFSGCSSSLKIYIPTGTKEQYKTALNGYYSSNLVEYDY